MIEITKTFNITKSSTSQTRIMSNNLRRTFLRSKISRDKLFRQEVKVQKLREETFNALKNALRDARNKQDRGGGLLGVALGLGGAGAIGRRFRGGGGGLRGGGSTPKLPRGPLAKSLSKFGRIGPMAIATTGLDFFLRKQQGQSNVQAGGGALAGLGGFAGGAKIGATLGSFVAPGVGTAVGGLLGGAIGGLVGGNLFDRLYGQNINRAGADLRRIREEEVTRASDTLFGENLDKFEIVLDKFAKTAPEFSTAIATRKRVRRNFGAKVSGTKFPIGKLIGLAFDVISIAVPKAQIIKLSSKLKVANNANKVLKTKNASLLDDLLKNVKQKETIIIQKNKLKERIAAFIKARDLNKIIGDGFIKFSKAASKIKPETLVERMTRAFNRNFPRGFKPALSKKGLAVREAARILKQEQLSAKLAKMFKFIKVKTTKISGRLSKKASSKYLKNKNAEDLFRDTQEIDGILQVISRALRQGTVPEGMNIEQFRKTVKAFQDVMVDMMDSKIMRMSKTELDDIFRELRMLSEKGVVPKSFSSGPRIEKYIKDILSEVGPPPGGMVGGRFSGPDTGYPVVLHGTERVIPEENPHTRSRGATGTTENTIVFSGSPNTGGARSNPPRGDSSGGGVSVITNEVDPFTLANKYSHMIASITV
tara:strand:- start:3465 stop:5414 length:1950 start_codon:yes stop_codon:yes gene_type:complete